MTKSDLRDRLQSLVDEYSLKLKPIENGFEIALAEGSETFEVWDETKEFILMADNWHEHCDTVDSLAELLNDLFKGEAWVDLKQTGHLLSGYQLMKKDGESTKILKETGMENAPSMRPKRVVRLPYKNGVRSSHRVA